MLTLISNGLLVMDIKLKAKYRIRVDGMWRAVFHSEKLPSQNMCVFWIITKRFRITHYISSACVALNSEVLTIVMLALFVTAN
jgi:hypothetical protein